MGRRRTDAIRMDALPFSVCQNALLCFVTTDEQSAQAISRRASEFVAVHRISALANKYPVGQFAQVFSCHRSLQRLDESRRYALAFVVEGFGTVVDSNTRLLAQKLVVGTLIAVLEAPPSAHVIDENRFVSGPRAQHVLQQFSQSGPMSKVKTASTWVCICLHYFEAVPQRIFGDCGLLIFNGVLLVVGGHPDILSRSHRLPLSVGIGN